MTTERLKVHMISLGCPKNLVDSEMMAGSLVKSGHQITQDATTADTVLINTCGFVEDAKKESLSQIFDAIELKKQGQIKRVVVAGCLTQRYKDELAKELPEADLFVGSGQFHQISDILKSSLEGNSQKTFYHLPTYLQKPETPRVNSEPSHRAYLKISEGCLKRCSFCAIPLIRGNLQSRRLEHVVSEAKLLAAGGVKELTVISHDFTDYGFDLRRKDSNALESPYQLLRALSDEVAVDWIRVLYLYPDGITPELVQLIRDRKNLVKYFDMPLQHINSRMLKEMNRKMTREKIEEVLGLIRSEIPEAVIRTQFIVGYPSETEEDFEELLDFINTFQFDRVGCFMYSPEENTPGGRRQDQIPETVKRRRFKTLMKLQQKISRKMHKRFVGKTMKVLVEGLSEESDLLLQGRFEGQAAGIDGVVYINDGKARTGEFVDVRITSSHDYDLVGHVVETSAESASDLAHEPSLEKSFSPLDFSVRQI